LGESGGLRTSSAGAGVLVVLVLIAAACFPDRSSPQQSAWDQDLSRHAAFQTVAEQAVQACGPPEGVTVQVRYQAGAPQSLHSDSTATTESRAACLERVLGHQDLADPLTGVAHLGP